MFCYYCFHVIISHFFFYLHCWLQPTKWIIIRKPFNVIQETYSITNIYTAKKKNMIIIIIVPSCWVSFESMKKKKSNEIYFLFSFAAYFVFKMRALKVTSEAYQNETKCESFLFFFFSSICNISSHFFFQISFFIVDLLHFSRLRLTANLIVQFQWSFPKYFLNFVLKLLFQIIENTIDMHLINCFCHILI